MPDPTVSPSTSLPAADKRDPKEKIPGLEFTWGDAEMLELSDDGITKIIQTKQSFPEVKLALIPLRENQIYIVRRCTRQEWKDVYPKFQTNEDDRTRVATRQDLTQDGMALTLQMGAEERLIEKFLVYPKLTLQEIRLIDGGDVKCLHDSIMAAMGFGQRVMAIKI